MSRRTRPQPPTVERKIYFYRANVGNDAAGRPLTFNPRPTLDHIHSLPSTNIGRYLVNLDGNAICCWIDRQTAPQRLRIANVRRTGLPQMELGGNLSPLNLQATSGLVELVHIVFFARGIVGSEFNFYGPRLSRLENYFLVRANGICPTVSFEPLLRQNIRAQLDRLSDIRLLQLKIQASYTDTIAQANQDLGAAFRAARTASDAAELEIVLRPAAYSRGRLAPRVLEAIKGLVGRDDLRSSASKCVIKGLDSATNHVEVVDVLSDQLISRKQIVLLDRRTRALNPDSAYAAIEEAYRELRNELESAAGVQQ